MRHALILAAVVSFTGAVYAQAPAGAGKQTVFVSVVDSKGAPVPNLTAADFTVKEDGKAQEIVSAAVATTPMQVALMVDNSGLALNSIREAAALFIQRLQGRGEISLIATPGRNLTVVPYTASLPALMEGMNKMLARNQTGGYLLDGLLDTSKDFTTRSVARPVIVMLIVPGQEFSSTRAEVVLDGIQRSRASVYVIELGSPTATGMGSLDAKADDSTVDESARRNAVLGAAPARTGGRAEQVMAASGLTNVMAKVAEELIGQYAITYAATGPANNAKLSVETKAKGAKVRAPQRVTR